MKLPRWFIAKWLVLAAAGAVLVATCTPPPEPPPVGPEPPPTPAPVPAPLPPPVEAPVPEPEPAPQPIPANLNRGPEVRIGILLGVSRVELSGDSGLSIVDADSSPAGNLDPGAAWTVRPDGPRIAGSGTNGWRLGDQFALTFAPRTPGGMVLLNGRPYRGRLRAIRDRTGITVINLVQLEDYLVGVVPAEMGRREPSEAEALGAQAIISRTFAIRNLGKRASEGFDLYATVVDQVYGGVSAENPLTTAAVLRTAGLILTWQGSPIDAFFFSTCGGRTADGTEVYVGADRPYLRSVSDLDGVGEAWCRISPRYQWREEWTAAELRSVLRLSLPPATGTSAEEAANATGVVVGARTRSGRVASLTIQLRRSAIDVRGPAVRQVLRPVTEPLLRSAVFRLTEQRSSAGLERLIADGNGAGHGVGFCQWGAVGRARGGQDAATILTAYFPGTVLSRAY